MAVGARGKVTVSWDTIGFDVVITIVLIIGFYKGYRSGIVNQGLWLGSLVVAYLIGMRFSYDAAALVGCSVCSTGVMIALVFVVLFCLTILILHYVGAWLTRLLNLSVAGVLNSILGGLLNVLVLVAVLAAVVAVTGILVPATERYVDQTITVGQIMKVQRWVRDERFIDRTRDSLGELHDQITWHSAADPHDTS